MRKFQKQLQESKGSLDKLRENFKQTQEEQSVSESPLDNSWDWLEQVQAESSETKAKRKVRLQVGQVSSCGCGGSTTIDVERWVDDDSPLQDGDIVSEFEDEDDLL